MNTLVSQNCLAKAKDYPDTLREVCPSFFPQSLLKHDKTLPEPIIFIANFGKTFKKKEKFFYYQ